MTEAVHTGVRVYPLTGTTLGAFATTTALLYELPAEVQVIIEADGIEGAPLTTGTQYTLTGADPLVTGGSVTLNASVRPVGGWGDGATGVIYRLILRRATILDQPRPFGAVSRFQPEASEQAHDKLTRALQDAASRNGRNVRVPQGESGFNLPRAADRALKLATFDAAGKLIGGQTVEAFDYQVAQVHADMLATQAAQAEVERAVSAIASPGLIYNRVELITNVQDVGIYPYGHAKYQSMAYNTAHYEDLQQEMLFKFGRGMIEWGYAPEGNEYRVGPSPLTDIFSNDGVPLAASLACLVKHSKISNRGLGPYNSLIKAADPTLTVMLAVSPDSESLTHLGLRGGFTTTNAGHGFLQTLPGPYALVNLAAPGTFEDNTSEGWAVVGTGTLSVVTVGPTKRLRCTANVGTVAPPHMVKAFATIIGENYYIAGYGGFGTAGSMNVSAASGSAAGTIYRTNAYLQERSDAMNFTATGLVTYIHYYPTDCTDGQNFEIDDITLVRWSLADQKAYVRNLTIEHCSFGDVGSYGVGVQNGVVSNLRLHALDIFNTGADATDVKARGDGVAVDGEIIRHGVISNLNVRKFGQRQSLTNQAGIDVRGRFRISDCSVYIENADYGTSRTGIRLRQGDSTATDHGPGAQYASIEGCIVEADNLDNSYGFGAYGQNSKVTNCQAINCRVPYEVQGLGGYVTTGVQLSGNDVVGGTWGYVTGNNSARTSIKGCQASDLTGRLLALNGDTDTVKGIIGHNVAIFADQTGNNSIIDGGRLTGTNTTKQTGSGTGCALRNVDGIPTKYKDKSTTFPVDAIGAGTKTFFHPLGVTPNIEDCQLTWSTSDVNADVTPRITAMDATSVTTVWRCTNAGAAAAFGRLELQINIERYL